ncbi:hypothetical protein [Tunicatimonas pelagia]|uniref:hypothetical protein n=1 Tax=Tunicatimonas pelagia TaxID=931531 RepID=UPI002666560F|nr:hypothetical protein [Tunicatimonas pelagia]WKN42660.1 hypothetical protein P0M28_26840 [Tunicatimonas pelagia]
MPTVSVSIDHFVEKKFEKLLVKFGYEYSKETNENEVSFVLTSDQEFDLVEISLLNECARQIQQLEDLDKEHYRDLKNKPDINLLKLGISNRNSN